MTRTDTLSNMKPYGEGESPRIGFASNTFPGIIHDRGVGKVWICVFFVFGGCKAFLWRFFILLFLPLAIMTSTAQGQTQHGVVKTKGRMVNGQLVHGQGLVGATVTVKGRTAIGVQNGNGSFSFPVPGQTFVVSSVIKKGYQLVDADAAPRQYSFSSTPIYLVMETPDEHLQDQLTAERKIRRTLQRRLNTLENEIEARNISFQEKQQLLEQLYRQQEGDEKLIAEMARRYAEMDFDLLDETNRHISDAILDGRLTEADSLLRTKGDLHVRIAEVQKAQAAEAREAAELARRQKTLAESRAGTQAKLADVARDCYTRYELCKMTYQMDSAAIYLVMRAELDSTNAIWQRDVAQFLFNYLSVTNPSIEYATRALRLAEEQQVEELQAELHMLLGDIYDSEKEQEEANEHYQIGATIIYKKYGESHPYVAEYFYRSLPKIAPSRAGFLLLQYEYQRSEKLLEEMEIDGQKVNPYRCIDIWEHSLLNPISGIDSCWVLRRLGDSYFYFRKDITTANNYYFRAMQAYEKRDGRQSLEVGRMLYRIGDCDYSLMRQSMLNNEQGDYEQWAEGIFGRLSLNNLAESADVLCSVVSPNHRDVRQALQMMRNVYNNLRNTLDNADSIYFHAHPLLARYQQLQQEWGVWEAPPDTATTDEGRLNQTLIEVWTIDSRRKDAWTVVWKKAHPDDNRFSMPRLAKEIKAGMKEY